MMAVSVASNVASATPAVRRVKRQDTPSIPQSRLLSPIDMPRRGLDGGRRRAACALTEARRGARTARRPAAGRSSGLVCHAQMGANTVSPGDVVSVNRKVGEGSFGQVFEGTMEIRGKKTKVIMKRAKPRVERSMELGEIEITLNQAANRRAKGACATYIGHMVVDRSESDPSAGLTEGLWLVWQYQGYKTLDSYLRQRDHIARLAYDLQVTEDSVVPTVMKQIFEALAILHRAKIVHRDLKPMNLIFCEDDRKFRLIDLGAAVDVENGTNFNPEESIFDPAYCAPEKYIMPTNAPDLASMGGPIRGVAAANAWGSFNPDRFDMYSAGIIMMQLAVPKLRTQSSLKAFVDGVVSFEFNPMLWAERKGLSARETVLLDDYDGAGWDLVAALLRERVMVKGKQPVSGSRDPRPSARQAGGYAFVKQAGRKQSLSLGSDSSPSSVPSTMGSWLSSLWGSQGSVVETVDEEEKVYTKSRSR